MEITKSLSADFNNTAVVIPIYNCARYLPDLIKRVKVHFPGDQIFVINDASTDNSFSLASGLGINVIDFETNLGKGAALQAGLDRCCQKGYNYAITLDGDLQHLPEEIPAFLKEQNTKTSDLVIGKRLFQLSEMPLMRICSNGLTSLIVSLVTGMKIKDSQSGYRLYSLALYSQFKYHSSRYQFETEIILKYAREKALIDFIPIKTIYGDQTSHIIHFRDIANFIKIVTGGVTKKENNENTSNQ